MLMSFHWQAAACQWFGARLRYTTASECGGAAEKSKVITKWALLMPSKHSTISMPAKRNKQRYWTTSEIHQNYKLKVAICYMYNYTRPSCVIVRCVAFHNESFFNGSMSRGSGIRQFKCNWLRCIIYLCLARCLYLFSPWKHSWIMTEFKWKPDRAVCSFSLGRYFC